MTPTKPEASAPVVTRADREAALLVLGYWPTPNAMYWVETGLGSFASDCYDAADRLALAIATARHEAEARGVARWRADVIQKLRERAVGLRSVTTLRTAYLSAACWIENGMPMREAGERIAKEGT